MSSSLAEPLNILKKTGHILTKIEDTFLVVCFSTIAIVLFLQIIFRYFLNSPLIWTEELSRYLLVWITFFGINYGLRRDVHIKMEFFFNKMPASVQQLTTILTQALMVYFMVILFSPTLDFVRMQMNIESSAMQISMGIVYISLPVGFALSSANLLLSTLSLMKSLLIPAPKG